VFYLFRTEEAAVVADEVGFGGVPGDATGQGVTSSNKRPDNVGDDSQTVKGEEGL